MRYHLCMESPRNRNWLKAIIENALLWLLAYLLCKYILLAPSQTIIASLPAAWLDAAGMLSGIAIFGSLYLMQEYFISAHGNLYRILYAAGCIGLAVLNANNLPVFTLQIVFVLYLMKKIIWSKN